MTAVTAVASDDEQNESEGLQANHAAVPAVPAVRQDWRNRGGVDRIKSYSAAAAYETMFHNSALLYKSITHKLADIEDLSEQITRGRPGLAYHLADFEDTLIQSWKCKMAQYLNGGRP